jgi:flagellar protein FliJ
VRRFAFQLDKVLELRRYHEQEWELKLAEVTGRVLAVEHELADWANRRQAASGVSVAAGQVDLQFLRSREDYVNLIDDRVRRLQSRLVSLEAEREKVRAGYLEASSARKALSKLRERRSDEYYKESGREEYRNLDEIAGSMSSRRRSESEEENV